MLVATVTRVFLQMEVGAWPKHCGSVANCSQVSNDHWCHLADGVLDSNGFYPVSFV